MRESGTVTMAAVEWNERHGIRLDESRGARRTVVSDRDGARHWTRAAVSLKGSRSHGGCGERDRQQGRGRESDGDAGSPPNPPPHTSTGKSG